MKTFFYSFDVVEVAFFRAGRGKFFTMLADGAACVLDGQGGIGPYVFSVVPQDDGSYRFMAQELGE